MKWASMSFLFEKVPVLAWLSTGTSQVNFRSMSLYRILMALMLLADYFMNILPNYEAFYLNQGLLPLSLWHQFFDQRPGSFTILIFSNAPLFHDLVQIVYVLSLVAFL